MESVCFKDNWEETIQRFDAWFHGKNHGRPIMVINAVRDDGDELFEPFTEKPFDDDRDIYVNMDKQFARRMNFYSKHKPMAEAHPQWTSILGAGSMALYLGGSDPYFDPECVWFEPLIDDYSKFLPLKFDPENYWWKTHLDMLNRQVELAKNTDMLICMPDIVENIDIVSAMRGPQQCCMDVYDYPEELHQAIGNVNDAFMTYYDEMHSIISRCGVNSYQAFDILGTGKTAKIQCDFSAMMSPEHYDEFVLPGLIEQCEKLDNIMYHLDGPEAICHADSILSIEKLGVLQWTHGAGNETPGNERWHGLYKKTVEAGKGLAIYFFPDDPIEQSIYEADLLVKKFGGSRLFFQFPTMPLKQAEQLLIKAEREWK